MLHNYQNNMKQSKYINDLKRWAFFEYLCSQKKKSTALGYMSSLSRDSFVNEIAKSKYHISDIFENVDLSILNSLYKDVIKDKRNSLGHSRYSAALGLYINYLNTIKK